MLWEGDIESSDVHEDTLSDLLPPRGVSKNGIVIEAADVLISLKKIVIIHDIFPLAIRGVYNVTKSFQVVLDIFQPCGTQR